MLCVTFVRLICRTTICNTALPGSVTERRSPYKDQPGAWGNDNFSGLYTASNLSSLFSYWYQNSDTKVQILVMLFQELGANSLTVAKHIQNNTDEEPCCFHSALSETCEHRALSANAGESADTTARWAHCGVLLDVGGIYLAILAGSSNSLREALRRDCMSDAVETE